MFTLNFHLTSYWEGVRRNIGYEVTPNIAYAMCYGAIWKCTIGLFHMYHCSFHIAIFFRYFTRPSIKSQSLFSLLMLLLRSLLQMSAITLKIVSNPHQPLLHQYIHSLLLNNSQPGNTDY
eukprot:sb/3476214/